MERNCDQQKIYNGDRQYYFFTWSVPDIFSVENLNIFSKSFSIANGKSYTANLNTSKNKISFYITSTTKFLKCFVTTVIGSETLLTSTLNAPTRNDAPVGKKMPSCYFYDLIKLSSEDESFQKLKHDLNGTLIFICKIIYSSNGFSSGSLKSLTNTSTCSFHSLKPLAAALKDSSESSSLEKISLRVGEETETVSKVVLCARSSVFAQMFENDMKELADNEVTITDIKMPVVKVLVSFMYTGELSIPESDLEPNFKFDFLCDLYYASDKYDIAKLRQLCVDLLIPLISMENINRIFKLAFAHNDELLKSTVIALIATNIKTWFSTNDWKKLVDDQPKIAAEVLTFFDF